MKSKKDDLFDVTLSRYKHIYLDFLQKRSLSYLAAIDEPILDHTGRYYILTPPQVGVLYSIKKDRFISKFDNAFLDKIGMFTDRTSLIFRDVKYENNSDKPNKLNLLRVIIFGTSPEERDLIDSFMGENLERYSKYVRMTSNQRINSHELLIDINLFKEIAKKPDKIKYKDIALVFDKI